MSTYHNATNPPLWIFLPFFHICRYYHIFTKQKRPATFPRALCAKNALPTCGFRRTAARNPQRARRFIRIKPLGEGGAKIGETFGFYQGDRSTFFLFGAGLPAVIRLLWSTVLSCFLAVTDNNTTLAFWDKYPAPSCLAEVGTDELAAFLKKHSKNYYKPIKAEQILEMVRTNGKMETE